VLRYQEELPSLATELALSEQRERRRTAQALHDRIGQVLALINIRIGALLESVPTKDMADSLREIRAEAAQAGVVTGRATERFRRRRR